MICCCAPVFKVFFLPPDGATTDHIKFQTADFPVQRVAPAGRKTQKSVRASPAGKKKIKLERNYNRCILLLRDRCVTVCVLVKGEADPRSAPPC